jgi:hypothetical protein
MTEMTEMKEMTIFLRIYGGVVGFFRMSTYLANSDF